MADQQQVSSLPLPPTQYINLYTDENVKRGRAPPPPPPSKDAYTMFGVGFHADDQIIRPLESQQLRRLYPQKYDHKLELRKLNHSILVNFLDLLDIMIRCPDSPRRAEKVDELTLLFIHMHHLINEFRPHQARETLRVMLDVQRTQRLDTAARCQRHLTKVQELLTSAVAALPDDSALDTKLTIKTEPMDTDGAQGAAEAQPVVVNGNASLDCPDIPIKRERTDSPEPSNGYDIDSVNIIDRMMCNITDHMT